VRGPDILWLTCNSNSDLNRDQHANLSTVYICVRIIVHTYTTQHRTVLIIFPLDLQTIIIALILSTGGEGATLVVIE